MNNLFWIESLSRLRKA